jgi:hypothetical protein
MPKFDKPKKRSTKVLIYKDLKEECAHIDEITKRCTDEVCPSSLFNAFVFGC